MPKEKVGFDLLSTFAGIPMLVDLDWGHGVAMSYLRELKMLEVGVPFKELGIGERREESRRVRFYGLDGREKIRKGKTFYLSSGVLLEEPTIVRLRLKGMMMANGGASTPGVDQLADYLGELEQEDNVKGVLVDVTSGGGQSIAGEMLYEAGKAFSKPLIYRANFMGSAAYMAALGGDEIHGMTKRAKIGSIGTLISFDIDWLTEYKERVFDVYSDLSPDKNKVFRAALEGDFGPARESVREAAMEFRGLVMNERRLKGSEEMIDNTLKGGMFTADKAKRRGLIDAIGGLDFSIKRINKLIELNN